MINMYIITFLSSFEYRYALFYSLQGTADGGRNVLLSWLHRYPDKSSLWLSVASYLLTHQSQQHGGAASTCAQAALSASTKHIQV